MTTLTLIRGLPGSGKSTLARALKGLSFGAKHFEADQFFTTPNGVYRFDATKLPDAHKWCFDRAKEAIMRGHHNVIVSNTFTTKKEMQPYVELADVLGANLQIILCQADFGSTHNVPEHVIENMKQRFEV